MISVVIPLYNKAHTITRTLQSVLTQTFEEFEVLIVNDGSTDNGKEIIANTFDDKRIIVIDQKNQGVSVARNQGVANAKYSYIAFLDGDDEWLPDYLLEMVAAIRSNPDAGMICCAGIQRNANGSESLRVAKKYKNYVGKINFFENPHVFLHTSAVIITKYAFDKAGGFPVGMKRNEDFALFFSAALYTDVIYCGKPLSVYVGGVDGQATKTASSEVLVHIVNRHNLVFERWKQSGSKNKHFLVFMRYELRHDFISRIKSGDIKSLQFLLEHLSSGLLRFFPWYERELYRLNGLKKIAVMYIMGTKMRWRMRGYPYVGQ